MRILDRYIATSILQACGVVGIVVAALGALTTLIREADDIGEGHYGVLAASQYVLLQLPAQLHMVFPVIAVLGALLALGGLAASRELVVVRASGVSIMRLAWSVARAGIVLAIVGVLLGEVLGPQGMHLADRVREGGAAGDRVQAVEGGLWLRDGNDIVRIGGSLTERVVVDVAIYRMGDGPRPEAIVRADTARYRDGEWFLRGVTETRFPEEGVQVTHQPERRWRVSIAPGLLGLSVVRPEELSSSGLWRYIGYLQRNDVATQDYRAALWRNLVHPVTVLLLAVFALPFAFGSLRSTSAGQRLFFGGLVGLVFFMLNEIVAAAGQVYGLPAWLAAAAPTGALGLITLVWLRRLR